jgi:hypothetical protein
MEGGGWLGFGPPGSPAHATRGEEGASEALQISLLDVSAIVMPVRDKEIEGAIGYLGAFFGSLGPCAGGPVSHRAMQPCP